MKIGIVTFNSAHNYGAVLQAWSLQTYLEKQGHDVDIVNLRPWAIDDVYAMAKKKRLVENEYVNTALNKLRIAKNCITQPVKLKRHRNFERFINTKLNVTKVYRSGREIREDKRLKYDESSRLSLGWNLNREVAKLNYRIHTDAIKENLLPPALTPAQIAFTYASEADMLNVALFGKTARQWTDANPSLKGNIRDYATLQQLLVLANMESYNAVLIGQSVPQPERMKLLRELAIQQLHTLEQMNGDTIPKLSK